MKKNDLVYVFWHDAHSAGGWHSEKETEAFVNKDRCLCENIGWFVGETKSDITLASRKMKWVEEGDSEYGLLQKIPKSCIISKRIVK